MCFPWRNQELRYWCKSVNLDYGTKDECIKQIKAVVERQPQGYYKFLRCVLLGGPISAFVTTVAGTGTLWLIMTTFSSVYHHVNIHARKKDPSAAAGVTLALIYSTLFFPYLASITSIGYHHTKKSCQRAKRTRSYSHLERKLRSKW